MTLKFIEKTHEYWLGDVRLPSVSEIINPLVDYSHIPPDVLANKAALGIEFHKIIDLHFQGTLNLKTIDKRLQYPYEAFCLWQHESALGKGSKFFATEKRLYHKRLLFAGTPDYFDDNDIYDFKLRPYNPVTDPLQLAGYDLLINQEDNLRGDGRWVVSFDLKGKYKMHSVKASPADGMFRKMLEFNNLLEKWRKQCF